MSGEPAKVRARIGFGRWLRGFRWPMLTGVLFAGGCMTEVLGTFQRELEVLFQSEANPLLVRDSFLVNLLGPEVLRLFH